mgnify:CR=1 FL=1
MPPSRPSPQRSSPPTPADCGETVGECARRARRGRGERRVDVNDIAAGAGGAALAIVRSSPPRLVPNEARRDERNAKELPLVF